MAEHWSWPVDVAQLLVDTPAPPPPPPPLVLSNRLGVVATVTRNGRGDCPECPDLAGQRDSGEGADGLRTGKSPAKRAFLNRREAGVPCVPGNRGQRDRGQAGEADGGTLELAGRRGAVARRHDGSWWVRSPAGLVCRTA